MDFILPYIHGVRYLRALPCRLSEICCNFVVIQDARTGLGNILMYTGI